MPAYLVYPKADMSDVLCGRITPPQLTLTEAQQAAEQATGRDTSLISRLIGATGRGSGRVFIAARGQRTGVIVQRVAA